jgi:two-component system alkaline phosphatase synthesis response regulator PhoP
LKNWPYLISMNTCILLVEDEENLRKTIQLNLEMEGYQVSTASTGTAGLEKGRSGHFDLIILDVMLPGIDGFDICREIRLKDTEVPILFLTAKGSGEDRVKGLKIGADDYLTKPFHLEEFLLRVSSLIRRRRMPQVQPVAEIFRFGGNEINFKTFEILNLKGEIYTLGKKEILLLKLLSEKENEVVSREEILEMVWGADAYPSTRTIDNYILAFRKYFEPQPRDPKYFHSIRGVGYKFTAG